MICLLSACKSAACHTSPRRRACCGYRRFRCARRPGASSRCRRPSWAFLRRRRRRRNHLCRKCRGLARACGCARACSTTFRKATHRDHRARPDDRRADPDRADRPPQTVPSRRRARDRARRRRGRRALRLATSANVPIEDVAKERGERAAMVSALSAFRSTRRSSACSIARPGSASPRLSSPSTIRSMAGRRARLARRTIPVDHIRNVNMPGAADGAHRLRSRASRQGDVSDHLARS